jgi:hypothetical protein
MLCVCVCVCVFVCVDLVFLAVDWLWGWQREAARERNFTVSWRRRLQSDNSPDTVRTNIHPALNRRNIHAQEEKTRPTVCPFFFLK